MNGTEARMRFAAHHDHEIATALAALAISWEECDCFLCRSADHSPLLEAADPHSGFRFLLVQCNSCGLCFTNPRPDLVSITQFYPADYSCHHAKPHNPATYGARLARLLPMHGLARLLDFGCGAGDFLRRMSALGWNVTGLDRSEAAVTGIRDLPAFVGTLPNPLWTEACFEAITMWQSLEHVHQPLEVLRAAYR